jgi:hypothetical protein
MYIENISLPSKISLTITLVLLMLSHTFFNNSNNNKILLWGIVQIIIFNFLCKNNTCWVSWSVIIAEIIFMLITTILFVQIFSYKNFIFDKNVK